MADQLRNPLCVVHVGLAARHVFDVVSISHNQVDVPLQHSVDRLPVHARALHADVSDAVLGKPRSECFELARGRAEAAQQLLQLAPWSAEAAQQLLQLAPWSAEQKAANDTGLVHVQTGTAFNES